VSSSHVSVDPRVPRLVDSIDGIPSIAFIFRPADRVLEAPAAVRSALDAAFAALGWTEWANAPVGFPGVEVWPGGCLLVFDYVDDEEGYRTFVKCLVIELERAGWSGALLPPPE